MSQKRLLLANLVFVDSVGADTSNRTAIAQGCLSELIKISDVNREGRSAKPPLSENQKSENDSTKTACATGATTTKETEHPQALLTGLAAVLTFEERPGQPFDEQLSESLGSLLHFVVDAAKAIGGVLSKGGDLLKILDAVAATSGLPEKGAPVTKLIQGREGSSLWQSVNKLFKGWTTDTLVDLELPAVTEEQWEEFRVRLEKLAPPPLIGGRSEESYELTQIFGWMARTSFGERETSAKAYEINDEKRAYGIRLEGYSRYDQEALELGPEARLDLFGPDGRHLLVYRLTKDALKAWLNAEDAPHSIEIFPPDELLVALRDNRIQANKNKEVAGRLWFSDGRPFGSRTLAFYIKPAIAKLVDDCCPPEDLDFSGCCEEEQPRRIPLLNTPQALSVTQTDQAGYFKFSYASDKSLQSKYCLLQVSGLAMPLVIELKAELAAKGKGTNDAMESRPVLSFPDPILLQVDSGLVLPPYDPNSSPNWTGSAEAECGCNNIDFGEPNRALDEFKMDLIVRTTDPMVVRQVVAGLESALDTFVKAPDGHLKAPALKRPKGSAQIDSLFREPLGRDNQIVWDNDRLVSQAVTIAHGRILTVSQIWRADGYSLGDLRYSLPLAPLQKKNIAIIDWDRQDYFSGEQNQEYRESLYNFVGRERDVSEIVNSAVNERITARSDSGGRSSSGGGGFSLGTVAFGGGSAGSSSAWSSSSQDSTRTLASQFMNQLRDKTVQSASALRSQRVTMVEQVSQAESARAVTETVANRNACHAITVQYFEVLRHFRLDHELTAVRECLFVPLPLGAFDRAKVLRWRASIEKYLPGNLLTYLDCCERLASKHEPLSGGGSTPPADKPPTDKPRANAYADERIQSVYAQFDIMLDFPIPSTPIAKEDTDWKKYFGIESVSWSPLPALFEKLKNADPDKRPAIYEQAVAPEIAKKVIDSLSLVGLIGDVEIDLGLMAELQSDFRAGARHRISFARVWDATLPDNATRRSISKVKLKLAAGLPELNCVVVAGGEVIIKTEHLNTRLAVASEATRDLRGKKELSFNLGLLPDETVDRYEDDAEKERLLLSHLNRNVEYYHKAIWWTMDPDLRYMLLDGFIAPNSGGRSVASVVENRVVSIIGNSLVMPVASGIRLDNLYENSGDVEDESNQDWLLALYRPTVPSPSTRVAIPTKGVFAESVMGKCNSCEKIDDSRNWKWWDHPLPDEPTPISPLTLGTPAKDTSKPDVRPMPSPVITQVTTTTPSAPEPVSTAAILAALTNPNVFPDRTGLAGTQQLAQDALAKTFGVTQKFGEIGGELSMKQLEAGIEAMKLIGTAYTGVPLTAIDSAGRVKKEIGKDVESKRITPEQGRDQIGQVNQRLIDMMANSPVTSIAEGPEVRDAIKQAQIEGAPVTVKKGDTVIDIGKPTNPIKHEAGTGTGGGSRPAPSARPSSTPKSRLPVLKIEIVTTIRDIKGAWEAGEKSRQPIVLDCDRRTLTTPTPIIGTTDVLGLFKAEGIRSEFSAVFDYEMDDDGPEFVLKARGQTASVVGFMPNIDYFFRLYIDAKNRRIRIVGAHDGFPSYTILIGGKVVYDREQDVFWKASQRLAGDSDVRVDVSRPF